MATHYYNTDIKDFIAFMTKFMNTFPGYPILLTEFAAQVLVFNFLLGLGAKSI